MGARIRWIVLVTIACATFTFAYMHMTYEAVYGTYRYVYDGAERPTLSGTSWGVFDPNTGEMIVSLNGDEQLPIASLSKLMTARVVLHDLDMTATATVSWSAVVTEGRAGRLVAGEALPVRELLFPLLLESSNDAAEVLAETHGRARFIARMNETASALGMDQTHFEDPSGLSEGNVSTVADMVRLVRAMWGDDRYVFDITRLPKYVGEERTWGNGNLISARREFLGGKNGYTEEAHHTLIAVFDQPLRGGGTREVGFVILGSEDVGADLGALSTFVREHVSYEYVL